MCIRDRNYTALKKKTENESDLRHGSMIEFMLHVGMHAEKMREIDNARQIYYLTTLDAKTLDYQIRKNAFVKCILKLSKLEYMRGISPAETLALQREAIEMINQSNLTGEDALLLLYAGMGEHFGGELELSLIHIYGEFRSVVVVDLEPVVQIILTGVLERTAARPGGGMIADVDDAREGFVKTC